MTATRRSGTADLPLHGGRVPPWLSVRMARLGRVVVEAVVVHYGRDELLRRLAHPFWFQSFGAVMGMDWHSSGITTSVLGALKRGLAPVADELGLWVCGGRGSQSRRTPGELVAIGERTGLDGNALARASRLTAKVDSAAVQDGHQLYLHGFVVTRDGRWVVVQQGMSAARRTARRYHWLSEQLDDFVDAPHAAIDGAPAGEILNLTDRRAAPARRRQVELAADPDEVVGQLRAVLLERAAGLGEPGGGGRAMGLLPRGGREALWRGDATPLLPHLELPAHHDVRAGDVRLDRLHARLRAAAERGPRDFPELLLTPGVGARTVAALALVAEVVHGVPARFADPARFALAHGGKDGHPFPVPLAVYDRTLEVLRQAVDAAKLGNEERLEALRRLDRESRRLEGIAGGPPLADWIAEERRRSGERGGRTVHDRPRRRAVTRSPPSVPATGTQLALSLDGAAPAAPRRGGAN